MKLFKYTALVLALLAGFTSCNDDDAYAPGEASDGVYFPTDDALEVNLDRNLDYFEVIVSRLGQTAAATYQLTGDADPEVFTLPTSVTFAEGEKSTKVKVGYTGANMAMDKAYPVKLAFAPGTLISTYGYESLEMAVTYPAPWKTIGKGMYRDVFILALTKLSQQEDFNPTWECELQQHEIDPLRFRWKSPYGKEFAKFCAANGVGELEASEYDSKEQYNIEFLCDESGYVVIPLQSTGFQFFSDGVANVCNDAGLDYPTNDYQTIIAHEPEKCGTARWGIAKVKDEETGEETEINTILNVFAVPKTCLVNFEGSDDLYIGGNGNQWVREGVEIKDYDISIKYDGVLTAPTEVTYAHASINIGEDIAKATAGMLYVADLEEGTELETAIQAVRSGAVPGKELEEKKNPEVLFAFEGSGKYAIAVIAYNEDGEEVATQAAAIDIIDNSAPKEWKTIGTGVYTDMYILPLFGKRDCSWELQVQQNTEDPTLFRYVHPYGTAFKEVFEQNFSDKLGPDMYDSSNVMYLNFIVKDNLVAVPVQSTGVNLLEDQGVLSAGNLAGIYYPDWSFEEILSHPQLGQNCFSIPAFSGEKLVSVTQPADATAIVFATDKEGSYHTLKNDTGGVQWTSQSAAAAPAKVPSARIPSLAAALNAAGVSQTVKADLRKATLRIHKATL
jgi:hypothetical protein